MHTLPSRLLPSFLGLLSLTSGAALAATTITIRPTGASSATTNGDAFLTPGPTNNLAANNYGGGGAIAVSTASAANGAFSTLLRFDISAATTGFNTTYGSGGWVLDAAVLQLTTATPNNSIFNASATGSMTMQWLANDAWTEGTGTPASPSASGVNWNGITSLTLNAESAGSAAVTNIADGATGNYSLTLGSGFAGDVSAGTPVSLLVSAADSTFSAVFNSRGFGTDARRPALILTASPVPEPAAGVLTLLASGLVCRRRRQFSR